MGDITGKGKGSSYRNWLVFVTFGPQRRQNDRPLSSVEREQQAPRSDCRCAPEAGISRGGDWPA